MIGKKHTFITVDSASTEGLRKAFAEIDTQPDWEVISVLDYQLSSGIPFGTARSKFIIILRIPG